MLRIATPGQEPSRFFARAIVIEEMVAIDAAASMIPAVDEPGCTVVKLFGGDAQSRTVFGPALIKHQAVGPMLANLMMQIRAAWRPVHEADYLLGGCVNGDPVSALADGCFASDTTMHVARDAVKIRGGNGYGRNFPARRFFRDAKVTQICEDTNKLLRTVIARCIAPGSHVSATEQALKCSAV